MKKVKSIFRSKVVIPVIIAIKSGTSVAEIAMTISLGAVIGIIPVFGINTALLLFIALKFKLNVLLIQAINYMVYPLQFFLYIPFVKMGQVLHATDSVPGSVAEFLQLAADNWLQALLFFGTATLWAVVSWLIISVPLAYLVYNLSEKGIVKFSEHRNKK